jgi:hypothetical protein
MGSLAVASATAYPNEKATVITQSQARILRFLFMLTPLSSPLPLKFTTITPRLLNITSPSHVSLVDTTWSTEDAPMTNDQ